jgi:hypothetical protein
MTVSLPASELLILGKVALNLLSTDRVHFARFRWCDESILEYETQKDSRFSIEAPKNVAPPKTCDTCCSISLFGHHIAACSGYSLDLHLQHDQLYAMQAGKATRRGRVAGLLYACT